MRKIDLEYFSEYKYVEKICKDIYGDKAVSAYIETMENTADREKAFVENWNDYYKKLKHLRWLRNQIAHENDSYEVTRQDIEDINQFHSDLLKQQDPLALLCKKRKKTHGNKPAKGLDRALKGTQLAAIAFAVLALIINIFIVAFLQIVHNDDLVLFVGFFSNFIRSALFICTMTLCCIALIELFVLWLRKRDLSNVNVKLTALAIIIPLLSSILMRVIGGDIF